MSQLYSKFFMAGLILTIFLSVLFKGAFLRIYTTPAVILIILLSAVFLILFNNEKISPKFNHRPDFILLLFLGLVFISVLFSVDREQSFFEFQKYAIYVGAYFIAGYGISEEDDKTVFLISLTGIGIFEALYGLYELTTSSQLFFSKLLGNPNHLPFISGTFANHNQFAGLLAMCAFIGLGLLFANKRDDLPVSENIARMLILFVPIGIIISALILSLSRGGWISFAVGAILISFIIIVKKRISTGKIFLLIFMIGVLSSTFIIVAETNNLIKRASTLTPLLKNPNEISSNSRLSLWKSSTMMIEDHPLTGTGVGTFKYTFPSYRNGIFKGAVYAHNGYLHLAAGAGIPALILFVVFSLSIIFEGLKSMNRGKKEIVSLAMPGLLGVIFIILVHEFVESHFLTAGGGLVFFSVAGMIASGGSSRK
jgi:O-antigen ligase